MSAQPILKALRLDFKAQKPAEAWRNRMAWTQRLRRLTQLAFAAFIVYGSIQHHLAAEDGAAPSLDALCPFGGVETLWRTLTSGGQFVPKTHASNIVLALGLLMGTLIAGGAFCGWVCPFGTIQDGLTGLRNRLGVREVKVPARLDRILRYGRFVVLALILYNTISLVRLWFADFDPYRTLFGLGWLFEFNWATQAAAYVILIGVLAASFFVERAWCRYACPLGGTISLFGKLSLFRIRRVGASCKSCQLCERPCPVKLPVATSNVISSDCIGCLNCVEACPCADTLEVHIAPTWLNRTRSLFRRARPIQSA